MSDGRLLIGLSLLALIGAKAAIAGSASTDEPEAPAHWMCAWCKQPPAPPGQLRITHGICKDCEAKFFPEDLDEEPPESRG